MRGGDPPSRIGDDSVGAGVGTARGHPVGHLLTGDDTFVLQKRRCIERVSPELSVFYSVMGNAPCDGVGVGSGFGFRIPQRGYVYSNFVIPGDPFSWSPRCARQVELARYLQCHPGHLLGGVAHPKSPRLNSMIMPRVAAALVVYHVEWFENPMARLLSSGWNLRRKRYRCPYFTI